MPALAYATPRKIGLDAARPQLACERLQQWTGGERPQAPSAAMVVGRRGKIVEPRLLGRQYPSFDAPSIRRNAMFLLASIIKPIVFSSAMRLVERGERVFSNRVTRYLPDFAAHHQEEVQVVHWFTHTSGSPDMPPNNCEKRRADVCRSGVHRAPVLRSSAHNVPLG